MGRMKDLHITIHNGGDEAVAAVERIGKEWREQLEQAASEIESLRLTAEEREAIERGIDSLLGVEDMSAGAGTADDAAACLLRSLLERMS
jgi:hypothetical protein